MCVINIMVHLGGFRCMVILPWPKPNITVLHHSSETYINYFPLPENKNWAYLTLSTHNPLLTSDSAPETSCHLGWFQVYGNITLKWYHTSSMRVGTIGCWICLPAVTTKTILQHTHLLHHPPTTNWSQFTKWRWLSVLDLRKTIFDALVLVSTTNMNAPRMIGSQLNKIFALYFEEKDKSYATDSGKNEDKLNPLVMAWTNFCVENLWKP